MKIINFILLFFLYTTHLIIMLLTTIGPYIIKDKLWLLIIILINMIIVTGWYLYGYCFLTDIENALNPSEKNTKEKSVITRTVEKFIPFLNEKQANTMWNCFPLISTSVCLYKLYENCK